MPAFQVPEIRLLGEPVVRKIVDEAVDVLGRVGVLVENQQARRLLADYGQTVDEATGRVTFRPDLIEWALDSAPAEVTLYDRSGNPAARLHGDQSYFVPGSSALHILDSETQKPRQAATEDVVRFVRLVDALSGYLLQSTGLIAADVPESVSDRYRLYLGLRFGRKPEVTGTFSLDGFDAMHRMLSLVRGGDRALRERPLAVFDCCPSAPLRWSELGAHDVMACAQAGIPAELVPMALSGATAPVTLAGTLVQVAAENLSGLVLSQCAGPGAPVIWGGSSAIFDMRHGTTPMGAVETMMIAAANAEIAKYLGLPCHAYLALSDAKQLDAQAGFETGMGAIIAVLAGVNVVSGPGMLDFESCQSLEKLVVDHEIALQALRLKQGIQARGEVFGEDLFGDIYTGDYFLTSEQTLRWFREEFTFPDAVVERRNLQEWEQAGAPDMWQRARAAVERRLAEHEPEEMDPRLAAELEQLMAAEARKAGMDRLPSLEDLSQA